MASPIRGSNGNSAVQLGSSYTPSSEMNSCTSMRPMSWPPRSVVGSVVGSVVASVAGCRRIVALDVEGEPLRPQPLDQDLPERRGRGAHPRASRQPGVEGEGQHRLAQHDRGAAVAGVVVRPYPGAVARPRGGGGPDGEAEPRGSRGLRARALARRGQEAVDDGPGRRERQPGHDPAEAYGHA